MKTVYFQPDGIKPQYCEVGIIYKNDPKYICYLEEPCKVLISEVKIIPKEKVTFDKKRGLYLVNEYENNIEIHYKATIWNKISLPYNITVEEIIEQLKEVVDPIDIRLNADRELYQEEIAGTEEFLPVEENDNQSTIELYVNNKKVWENGK